MSKSKWKMVQATCPICNNKFLIPERYFVRSVWNAKDRVLHRIRDDRAYHYHDGCPSNGVIKDGNS